MSTEGRHIHTNLHSQSNCHSRSALRKWSHHNVHTLNTSLTAVISSGPTPSPGTMVTLNVASARAGGASGPPRLAVILRDRAASCCHRGPMPVRPQTRTQQLIRSTVESKHNHMVLLSLQLMCLICQWLYSLKKNLSINILDMLGWSFSTYFRVVFINKPHT